METLIQDCKLFYRCQSNENSDAPVVLFLHGWGCDGSIFSVFEKECFKHATVLTVDFPGHGQSGEPQEPWGVPEYAQQIYALLNELNIPQVYIVAHSFGGRVALWLAAHYPQLVQKMIITGGAGLRSQEAVKPSKRQRRYKQLKEIVNHFGKIPFLRTLTDRLQEMLIQKYGSADYKKLNANMRKTFVKVINQDLSSLLSKITASTLLVWGSNDTETPLWMGQKMQKEIADAGLIVFDGRTHFAFLEEAQRFLVILNSFFWGGNV